MFYRLTTDGMKLPVPVHDMFAGPYMSTCWIVGGGPSLAELPTDLIQSSPAPVFSMNLAGSGLLRPNFWTSYDPTARFHRSTYLDPSIIKFVHRSRAMDLIPESTFKVCEAPAVVFFDRQRETGFHNFPTRVDSRDAASGITDWQDSLIQAIDIAYRLGFRRLLLAGCDLLIAPDAQLQSLAKRHGVDYTHGELLSDFIDRCRSTAIAESSIDDIQLNGQYHFNERKPIKSAIQTDFHYFRVVQYLRLSRRTMVSAGLEIVSVTHHSRLNDHFPVISVEQSVQRILDEVGDPDREQTLGRYTSQHSRQMPNLGPMRDFRPHFWKANGTPPDRQVEAPATPGNQAARQRLRRELEDLPEIAVNLKEDP